MTKSLEILLESFERLPDEAKREAASQIIRRSLKLNLPPLEDGALVEAADNIFLELEKHEFQHGCENFLSPKRQASSLRTLLNSAVPAGGKWVYTLDCRRVKTLHFGYAVILHRQTAKQRGTL